MIIVIIENLSNTYCFQSINLLCGTYSKADVWPFQPPWWNVCIEISPPVPHMSTLPINSNESIAKIITAQYGQPVLRTDRKFETADFNYRKLELDLELLNNCIKHELIPTFVRFKVANHQLKNSKVYKDCQMRLLRKEVTNKKSMLYTMSTWVTSARCRISRCSNDMESTI